MSPTRYLAKIDLFFQLCQQYFQIIIILWYLLLNKTIILRFDVLESESHFVHSTLVLIKRWVIPSTG